MDRRAWRAAVHGVTQSWTWLKRLSMHACIGEGNGNPLQYSCLENPRDSRPGGLLSMGLHRVAHDWSDLAAASWSDTHFPRRIQQLSFCYFQISLHLWPSGNPGITCPHPSEISQPCGPWSAKLPHKIMSAHSKNSGNVIFLLFGQDWGCENMLIPWAISSIFFLEQDRKKNKNKITHTHTN